MILYETLRVKFYYENGASTWLTTQSVVSVSPRILSGITSINFQKSKFTVPLYLFILSTLNV